ncbi:SRPBCC family protein [Methylobacterium sp. J-043]|nr:SRPBCC family protein [Methylobacterium sp. J-043]
MQIQASRTVVASPAEVFSLVSNAVEWPLILRSVESAELVTEGALGVGSRLRERRLLLGADAVLESEVIEFARPHRFRLFVASSDHHFDRDFMIDAVASGGSRLTLVIRPGSRASTGRALLDIVSPVLQVRLSDELELDIADFAAALPG